jgi:hypothetical protein
MCPIGSAKHFRSNLIEIVNFWRRIHDIVHTIYLYGVVVVIVNIVKYIFGRKLLRNIISIKRLDKSNADDLRVDFKHFNSHNDTLFESVYFRYHNGLKFSSNEVDKFICRKIINLYFFIFCSWKYSQLTLDKTKVEKLNLLTIDKQFIKLQMKNLFTTILQWEVSDK